VQPFSSHSQQLPLRYIDSDMAKKRPFVISFRRIQKMTPNGLDGSVSICDIHRQDTKMKNNNEKKRQHYGANFSCSVNGRNDCQESQSYRSFAIMKRQSRVDSIFNENVFDENVPEKSSVLPKEKFYGNAKLLMKMKEDIMLRKSIPIYFDDDPFEQYISEKHNPPRWFTSHKVTIKDSTKHQESGTLKYEGSQLEPAEQKPIEPRMCEKFIIEKYKRRTRSNTKASRGLPKSSSADILLKKLSTFKERSETEKTLRTMQKSVSLVSFSDEE
jgi:hypothetical protein